MFWPTKLLRDRFKSNGVATTEEEDEENEDEEEEEEGVTPKIKKP